MAQFDFDCAVSEKKFVISQESKNKISEANRDKSAKCAVFRMQHVLPTSTARFAISKFVHSTLQADKSKLFIGQESL